MKALEPFYKKEITCIFCGASFFTLRVRSRFSIPYKIDSDFCPHYREGNYNPYFYYVSVCPKCGFAFSKEFSDQFPAGSREEINFKITQKWVKRDLGDVRDIHQALETYKLAILAASLKQERNIVLAGLCLRLAWLYRSEKMEKQEKRFLTLALKSYEESFIQSDFVKTSMSELNVMFMIGEISRRLGQYKKAITYFSKIIQHKNADSEPKMVKRAREQWKVTKEEYDQKVENGNKIQT